MQPPPQSERDYIHEPVSREGTLQSACGCPDLLVVFCLLQDIEAVDPDFYKNLRWMLENEIADVLDLTFTEETDYFGRKELVELKPDGANMRVTDANKREYVNLVAQHRMTTVIRSQINAFLQGFWDLVPKVCCPHAVAFHPMPLCALMACCWSLRQPVSAGETPMKHGTQMAAQEVIADGAWLFCKAIASGLGILLKPQVHESVFVY